MVDGEQEGQMIQSGASKVSLGGEKCWCVPERIRRIINKRSPNCLEALHTDAHDW